jgi:hypothetical protein
MSPIFDEEPVSSGPSRGIKKTRHMKIFVKLSLIITIIAIALIGLQKFRSPQPAESMTWERSGFEGKNKKRIPSKDTCRPNGWLVDSIRTI